jgi:mannitol/fructose-specific phosphotransferase system IIA component (Ntr-type)
MATWKPELHNAEDILNYYDQYDEAGYSVYAGHKPDQAYCRFTYTGSDKVLGREKLQEALASVLSNPDNTNVYLLQILGNKGKKTEVLNSITFQLNKAQSVMPYQQMGMVNPNLMNEINALRSEIAALKMQQEIEEDDEDEEPEEENFLAGLMKSPQVQTMILSQLSSLFAPTQKVTHVAGIEKTETMANETEIDNEERIYDAVERLKLVDDQLASDLELLCEMAETDKMQFNFLLKMLRK